VAVIATEVETGEIVWSGSARMPPRTVADYSHKISMGDVVPLYHTAEKMDAQTLSVLACHALGTAFEMIAPGRYRAPLDERCD
jgi:hypothetical protein